MPTSNEICAPYSTRENKSRPCKSVPNQCCAFGELNCASEISLGLCICANGVPPNFKIIGHATTATSNAIKNHALMIAARLRLNLFHASFAGEICWFGSLIFHARVENGINEIHSEIHSN